MLDLFYTSGGSELDTHRDLSVDLAHVLLYSVQKIQDWRDYLGEGAYRVVYDLSNGWVVKYSNCASDNLKEYVTYHSLPTEHLAAVVATEGLLRAGVIFMEKVEPIECDGVYTKESDSISLKNASHKMNRYTMDYLEDDEAEALDEYFEREYLTEPGSFMSLMNFIWKWKINDAHDGNIGIKNDRFVMLDYNHGYNG